MKELGFALLYIIIIALVLAGVALFVFSRNFGPFSGEVMTFEVDVPQNTPSDNTIHIFLNTQKNYKMKKVDDFKFSITLPKNLLDPGSETIRYRYSRNGYNFRTAEYLEPDTNDFFWTQKGRTITYKKGFTQKDVVERWRFFPEENVPIVKTSELVPSDTFLPRINGEVFQSGQIIEDFYEESFRDFFDSTATHMKKVGYNSVEIDPPWQLIEENGLPKMVNFTEDNPNYPDDETLTQEIRAFKKQGFVVILAPQHCCEAIDTQDRSRKWWDIYFNEVTRFLVHFAQIAQESGVDYFHFAVSNDYQEADAKERWSSVFRKIRSHYNGKVGEMVWNFVDGSKLSIIPNADYIKWGHELDYFYVALDAPISLKDNPTDDELNIGAANVVDVAKVLYDTYKKPVMLRTAYFNVKQTWRGSSFYQINSVPWISDPESKIKETKYEFSTEDLARVVHAYFRAIAERPWIVRYAQFGYTHWENPLATELSVRGKPAEDIWQKWNKFIFDSIR